MTNLHLEAPVQRGEFAEARRDGHRVSKRCRRRAPLHATLACAALALAALALPRVADAARAFQRLDPRLSAALVTGAEPLPVWVEFVDKGEAGVGDLQRRLDAAERALTAGARARRIRAGLHPLVDYLDLPIEPSYLATLAAAGYQPYGASRWLNACCVRTSGPALASLASLDCVRLVSPAQRARVRRPEPILPAPEPEYLLSRPAGATAASGTPGFYGQTYTQVQRLNVPAVHDSGYIGAGVLVAVFDEGFNYYDKHEATRDLDVGNRTRDFVRGGSVVQDTVGFQGGSHGTNTLSVLAGDAPGIYVGPAYGARFALARTEDQGSEKPVEMVNWLNAAEWADSLGADVISSSLGYFDFPDSAGGAFGLTFAMLDGHTTIITRAAEIAAAKGIIVVNSAGNSGPNPGTLDAPADADGDSVLAIGAVDSLGVLSNTAGAYFSSRGPTADGRIKPDLCAQGYRVLIASAGGSTNAYFRASGTSFSCPLVAGLAACLISARPNLPPIAIIRGLKLTANRAAHPDNNYGWGVPDGMAVLGWTADTLGVPVGAVPYLALRGENPVHEGALLRFGMPLGSAVADGRVDVYDISGRRVRALWRGTLVPGLPVQVWWDGADARGHARDSGLYFASLEAGGHRAVIRLATIR